MNNTVKRIALPLGAAVVIGSSGFAFMASNSVPETRAGDGSNVITGYTVSNVDYDTDNGRIIALRFDLDGAAKASNVKAYVRSTQPTNENGTYDNCRQTGASGSTTSWFCDQNPGQVTATVARAEGLRVIAAQ